MDQVKIKNILKAHNYDFFQKNTTSSTMLDVHKHLKEGKKNCIYLSNQQTNGRGQRGKIWDSPIGNIYCSISFDNFLNIKDHFLFSVLISTTIKMSLEKFEANYIFFKWPNDIFYKKKKFAGMISEIVNISKIKSYIIIGFGINLISSPDLEKYNATYAKSFSKIKSIDEFLLVFIKNLFLNLNKLKQGKKNYLMNFFTKSLMFNNEKISIVFPNGIEKNGIFRGVNNDGSLRLETEKSIENIYNGSINL